MFFFFPLPLFVPEHRSTWQDGRGCRPYASTRWQVASSGQGMGILGTPNQQILTQSMLCLSFPSCRIGLKPRRSHACWEVFFVVLCKASKH